MVAPGQENSVLTSEDYHALADAGSQEARAALDRIRLSARGQLKPDDPLWPGLNSAEVEGLLPLLGVLLAAPRDAMFDGEEAHRLSTGDERQFVTVLFGDAEFLGREDAEMAALGRELSDAYQRLFMIPIKKRLQKPKSEK